LPRHSATLGGQPLKILMSTYHVKKIKQFLYSPGQALRVPAGLGSLISRQWAHESGKVVSSAHRPPLPLRTIPGTHCC